MRFGFFFFAEYVNLFIMSALTTTLFLGGWNAPLDAQPVLDFFNVSLNTALDPGALGMGLLFLVALGPPLLIVLFALPFWMLKSHWSFLKSLVVGFLLFNLLVMLLVGIWAYATFPFVAGLFWFLVKTFTLVALFVIMRGTLPRVRMDQLMGFAWKWLISAALLNLLVTAAAIVVLRDPSMPWN
jgi:NADH-quinone oxidoreductase subunit H